MPLKVKQGLVDIHFLLPNDLDVELSAPFQEPCPTTCCPASCHENNGLLRNCKPAPKKCFLYKGRHAHDVPSQQ